VRECVYRVYFNRFNEAPHFWSVDTGEGTEELKLTDVQIVGGRVSTGVDVRNRGSEDKPCAWLQVEGSMTLEGSRGTIRGEG
jgi:hypothetical protein